MAQERVFDEMTLDKQTKGDRQPDGLVDAVNSDGRGPSEELVRRHRNVGLVAAIVPIFMLGMAYASVPLYQMFCRVTGYGGTTRVAVSAPNAVLDRTISIRFDSNVSNGLDWTFKPVVRTMKLKIGESRIATYTAVNNSNTRLVGTAAFNVTPESVGVYFNKIECFCFTEQILEPGEKAELPVSFFIDPEILDDVNTQHLSEITLSYTFFPTEEGEGKKKDKQASTLLDDRRSGG